MELDTTAISNEGGMRLLRCEYHINNDSKFQDKTASVLYFKLQCQEVVIIGDYANFNQCPMSITW